MPKMFFIEQGDAAGGVVLQLGDGHEDVGVVVDLVEVVGREHLAAAGHGELHVLLLRAEPIGVLEADFGRTRFQSADVPAGVEHVFFKRSRRGPGAFDEADAAGAGAVEEMRERGELLGWV